MEGDARPENEGRALLELKADCANCFGLCCVALSFAKSADFAFDKPAGEPCVNLDDSFRCGIHSVLRDSGFKGCTVYDCFGAGQKVAQGSYGGVSWRDAPETASQMFAVFPVMRQLHELLWYLEEALLVPRVAHLHAELREARDHVAAVTDLPPDALAQSDVAAARASVGPLLQRVSEVVRADARRGGAALPKKIGPNSDLLGATLAGMDLRGANLRGAYLIAADLSGSDLSGADLLGADLRDADVSGSHLENALFLTQFQVGAARGDAETSLSPALGRPPHWV